MNLYGLIGKDLSHSFSKKYFTNKFVTENINNCTYSVFEIKTIGEFRNLVNKHKFKGMNVTIPFKETIIPFLDELSTSAKKIGAVNTIQFKNDKLIGHNTDYFGFKQTIKPFLGLHHERALILGTGGASKAVSFVLNQLNIEVLFASRAPKNNNEISYNEINENVIKHHQIIINTTPLGMYPNINTYPNIPYNVIGKQHLLYDLIYNPKKTIFLKKGGINGATVINGEQMLVIQAEKAWEIWND